MATLNDLANRPVPKTVDLNGRRMAGTVPVAFSRASDWSRVVTFGDAMFNTENVITVNSIDYTIAGLTIIEQDRVWQRHSYRYLRRAGTIEDGTHAAHHALSEWAIRIAGELAERHPDAFTTINPHSFGSSREAGLTAAATRFAADAEICRAYVAVHQAVDQNRTTTRRGSPHPEPVRWITPDSRREMNDSLLYARQPAEIVATVHIGDEPIAYVLDARSEHGGRPSPRGGLLVPVELVRNGRS